VLRHNGPVTEPAGTPTIRRALPSDVPALVELLIAGAVAGTPEDKEDRTDTAPYRAALTEIEAAGNAVLVAEEQGVVVGMCQLVLFRHFQGRGGRCAEIESVHVRAESRKRGIGSALVRAAVEVAQAGGCYRIQLTSNVVRDDAHRFYRSLGFEPTHVGFKLQLG
jgi:ribosomal protein S18 acetylase RimI-like enzyme